jgi:N6-adenosine-specific RNA methylase IME4
MARRSWSFAAAQLWELVDRKHSSEQRESYPPDSMARILPKAKKILVCSFSFGKVKSELPNRAVDMKREAAESLLSVAGDQKFGTILADPPWQFTNRTGKVAPEHRRLSRYGTMTLDEICALPISRISQDPAHLYLWVPNALLPDGLKVMAAWGFQYKSNIVWHKVRKDGGSDGRGVGFYFRNVTELLLFGVRGKNARTLAAGRRQVNLLATRKREHSRKPDELYEIVEACSWGPRIELFARGTRPDWFVWGNEATDDYRPQWNTYAYNSGQPAAE